MIENVDYEKVVTAKIYKEPEYEIPEVTPQEIIATSVGTLRSTIWEASNAMIKDGSFATKALKVTLTATAEIPFTAMDIIMSYREEGIVQATVTAITAAGISIAFGVAVTAALPAASVTMGGAIALSLVTGIVNYGVGKLIDGVYDFIEDEISYMNYSSSNKELIFNTKVASVEDIKTLIAPMVLEGIIETDNVVDKFSINQLYDNEITTYTVKSGDNIDKICMQFGISYDELIESNPWLAERFNNDKSFALIKPNEILKIPCELIECKDYFLNDENLLYNDLFIQAQSIPAVYRDPLLIDLNGDGIKTTTIENGTYFDHDNNGYAEKTSWVDQNDGIFVYDKNNNGIIENGTEVMGDSFIKSDGTTAANGFEALKSFDSNNDNVINASDILKGDGTHLTLLVA